MVLSISASTLAMALLPRSCPINISACVERLVQQSQYRLQLSGWEYDRDNGTTEPTTRRHQCNKWFVPFCRHLGMEYPSGIRHIIFNWAPPISVGRIQVVRLLFRNDTEADCSTKELVDWDAAIIAEDRDKLESTDPDAIVDTGREIEMHMPSGRPGMIMRASGITACARRST
jgi:hypothetical protein